MKLDFWGFSTAAYKHPAIDETSDSYLHTPSQLAQNALLYPMHIGHYLYHKDFYLHRNSYDSFLLLYIQKGSLHCKINGIVSVAERGNFVLLDCYAPHDYYTTEDCECLWMHFDGHSARTYYQLIAECHGMIFSLPDALSIVTLLNKLYQIFADKQVINEILLSKYICDLLSEILLQYSSDAVLSTSSPIVESAISFINSHLAEELSVKLLAKQASMSVYHFIRIFKKIMHMTPHKYIANARILRAMFLLEHSDCPVKEICYACGFSDPGSFSTCFKNHTGTTPSCYRASHRDFISQ